MQAAIANCYCIANTGLLITQISMIMGYKRHKWRFTGFEYKYVVNFSCTVTLTPFTREFLIA